MPEPTLFWHDYETFGADPRRDRPAQFAGIRTDMDLNPVGDPVSVYCQPSDDYLPVPRACLITRITPQKASAEGVPEPEFVRLIERELSQPMTCTVGYNNLRFDDEVTRHVFYRNFFDPYAREWSNGNSRWDIIDVGRLCYALRPDGVQWPQHEDGSPSFRLEDLTRANDLTHGQAHDALSDVEATIGLGRLLKKAQPRLFQWCFELRKAAQVSALINWKSMEPVLHISRHFPAARGCLAMVVPIALHPRYAKRVICYDLAEDPTPLFELSPEDIADRVFTPSADLPEDVKRIRLKTITMNKCPVLAPLSTLAGVDTDRIGLDVAQCQRHLELIREAPDLREKLQAVFIQGTTDGGMDDPDVALYSGGLIDRESRSVLQQILMSPESKLPELAARLTDKRLQRLVFRYRARNFPGSLTPDEHERWQRHRRRRLLGDADEGWLNLETFSALLREARELESDDPAALGILDELESYGRQLTSDLT